MFQDQHRMGQSRLGGDGQHDKDDLLWLTNSTKSKQ